MKRITIFAISILIAGIITAGAFCTKTFAALPPKAYEKMQNAADVFVSGNVKSYEIKESSKTFDDGSVYNKKEIFYNVEVTQTTRGNVKPGSIITLSKNCDLIFAMEAIQADDQSNVLSASTNQPDCPGMPIRIGQEMSIYMDVTESKHTVYCITAPCPPIITYTYTQAIAGGSTIENVDKSNANENYINLSVWYIAGEITIGAIVIATTVTVSVIVIKKRQIS